VSFMRPVRAESGELTVTGRLVKGGRRVAFAEAQAHDGTGTLVGTASSTLLIAGP
jgi:acyl-coenzyme A thioesterase PaaI-like protein